MTWQGRFRPALHEASPNPRPVGALPVWVAVGGTPSSAARAGRLGLPMALGLIGGPLDQAKQLVDLYRRTGREAGHSESRLQVGITSHFYVSESREQALEEFFPYYQRYLAPETNNGRGWRVDEASMRQMAERRGALMVGGPREVAARTLDLASELGADRFLGQVDPGGMPADMVRASIARFGDAVAPAVRHVLN